MLIQKVHTLYRRFCGSFSRGNDPYRTVAVWNHPTGAGDLGGFASRFRILSSGYYPDGSIESVRSDFHRDQSVHPSHPDPDYYGVWVPYFMERCSWEASRKR
jgi:hypothetical protein